MPAATRIALPAPSGRPAAHPSRNTTSGNPSARPAPPGNGTSGNGPSGDPPPGNALVRIASGIEPGTRFVFADALRGIASLWLVLFHLSEGNHIDRLKAALPAALGSLLFEAGDLRVPVFFALSGFVMTHTLARRRVDARETGVFLLRRLARLTPPYWCALAVCLALLMMKSRLGLLAPGEFPGADSILAHLAYLQEPLGIPEINIAYWTLWQELQFYGALIGLVWLADALTRRTGWPHARLALVALSALVTLPWTFGWTVFEPWRSCFVSLWFCFVPGVLARLAVGGGRATRAALFVHAALLCVAFAHTGNVLAVAAAATALLLWLAGETGGLGRWLNWRWLQFIALISYSLYLLHNPVTGAVANVVRRFVAPSTGADVLVAVACVTASVLAAWVLHRIVEVPAIRLSRSFGRATRRTGAYAGLRPGH